MDKIRKGATGDMADERARSMLEVGTLVVSVIEKSVILLTNFTIKLIKVPKLQCQSPGLCHERIEERE